MRSCSSSNSPTLFCRYHYCLRVFCLFVCLFVSRINPQYVDAILNLAAVLNEKQNAKEAEKLYAKALTLQPSHVDALNNYGVFLAKMGWWRTVLRGCRSPNRSIITLADFVGETFH